MGTILFYIFESTLCLTILYFLFRLFFRKDTLFRTNRFLLLAGTMACMLLPLLQIDVPQYTTLQLPITTVRHLLTEKEIDVQREGGTGEKHLSEEARLLMAEKGEGIEGDRTNVIHTIPVIWLLGGCYFIGALIVLAFLLLSTIVCAGLSGAILPVITGNTSWSSVRRRWSLSVGGIPLSCHRRITNGTPEKSCCMSKCTCNIDIHWIYFGWNVSLYSIGSILPHGS